ncbi:exonuclease [Streptosporangium jomthongense]|uniref:Metallophosphoesterase n=1 Tax=Marinobacter aromaticivorans TaxID=1494078 RepID=A0ABW2IWY6_9GAMM|nr:metallophosphoesterase [Marinobacter aromaticivorans]GGE69939.1 exonuclease [Streptosporangium jomthongense]
MPRFLHTADWQMGRTYSRFDTEDSAALVEARYEAIERLAALATEHQCDAVLVAGDVFDAQTVADRTIRRVFNATKGFSGPWIMLPGNHDAALAESVWTRAKRLDAVPDNVHLLLEPGVIRLPEQGMAVLAAPLTQRHTYGDLTAPFNQMETPPGLLRIGLAHGSVQGVLPEDIDSTNPIAPDRAATAKLDYLALGDWHGTKQINERTWYSGTPEPERFRNNEAGYVLIVDIDTPGATPQISRHKTARYQWHQWQESFSVPSDVDDLLNRINQLPEASVLDIKLSGTLTLAGDQKLTEALAIAEARFRSVTCDRSKLQLEPTEDDIAELQADGYLGEVVQQLRETQQVSEKDDEAATARDALAILASLLKSKHAGAAQ